MVLCPAAPSHTQGFTNTSVCGASPQTAYSPASRPLTENDPSKDVLETRLVHLVGLRRISFTVALAIGVPVGSTNLPAINPDGRTAGIAADGTCPDSDVAITIVSIANRVVALIGGGAVNIRKCTRKDHNYVSIWNLQVAIVQRLVRA